MPLFTFGIGAKCGGVVEKESLEEAKKFINCGDPEGWVIEFDFKCYPVGSGNTTYTLINFGDFTAAYDFRYHLSKWLGVKVINEDDNLLRINGYHLREVIRKVLLKRPFQILF